MTLHDYHVARERMVRQQLEANGIRDPRVLNVMRQLPRHVFLHEEAGPEAYSNHALPIGHSQTMTQPYMVGYLAEHLMLTGDERVLEVGTGSGYQAAVVAQLANRVYTLERIHDLAERARAALDTLQIRNVWVSVRDGALGWPENGPFDRILLTAAATDVPNSLLGQLRDGGFLLGPAKKGDGTQEIIRLHRNGAQFSLERLADCAFVPLVREVSGEESLLG